MEITQSEFEKYLRNISYFLTFGWLIITFAVIVGLVKYKDPKLKAKIKRNDIFNNSMISLNRDDCVYVNIWKPLLCTNLKYMFLSKILDIFLHYIITNSNNNQQSMGCLALNWNAL